MGPNDIFLNAIFQVNTDDVFKKLTAQTEDISNTLSKSFGKAVDALSNGLDGRPFTKFYNSTLKMFFKKSIDLHRLNKIRPLHGFVKKDQPLIEGMIGGVDDLNKSLKTKNSYHSKQNTLLGIDLDLLKGILGQANLNNEAFEKAVVVVAELGVGFSILKLAVGMLGRTWKSVFSSIMKADEATKSFITTNYRLYDSQYGLVQTARELSVETGMAAENSLEAIKALSDLATPKAQMKDLGDSILRANQYLGIAIGDLADFSRENRFAGGDIKNFNRMVQYSSDAMKKYGLNSQDVNSILKSTEITTAKIITTFGKFATRSRDENGKLITTFELLKQAQLSVGGAAKSMGFDAKEAADSLKVLFDPQKAMIFRTYAERLKIPMKTSEDAMYGMAALVEGMSDNLGLSLNMLESYKDFGSAEQQSILSRLSVLTEQTGLTEQQILMYKQLAAEAKKANVNISDPKVMEAFLKARNDGTDPFNDSLNTLTGQLDMVFNKFKALTGMINSFLGAGLMEWFKIIKVPINIVASALNSVAKAMRSVGDQIPLASKAFKMLSVAVAMFVTALPTLLISLAVVSRSWKILSLVLAPVKAAIVSIAGVIGWPVAALTALGVALYLAYQQFELVRNVIDYVWQSIKYFASSVYEAAKSVVTGIIPSMESVYFVFEKALVIVRAFFKFIAIAAGIAFSPLIIAGMALYKVFSFVFPYIQYIVQETVGTIVDLYRGFMSLEVVQMFLADIKLGLQGIADAFKYVWSYVEWFDNVSFSEVGDLLYYGFTDLGPSMIKSFLKGIYDSLPSLSAIGQFLYDYVIKPITWFPRTMIGLGISIISSFVEGIRMALSGSSLSEIGTMMYNNTFGLLLYKISNIKEIPGLFLNALYEGFMAYLNVIDTIHTTIYNYTFGLLFGKVDSVFDIGKNLLLGLYDGLVSALSIFGNVGKMIYDSTIGRIASALGIASPSVIMTDIGNNVMLGLLNGLMSFRGLLVDSVFDIGKNLLMGLYNGIVNTFSIFGNIGKMIYDNTIGRMASALGIASPSTIMTDMGNNVMLGLLNGLMNFSGLQTIVNFVGKVAGWFSGLFGGGGSETQKIAEDVKSLTGVSVPLQFGEDYKTLMTSISEGSTKFMETLPAIQSAISQLSGLQTMLGTINFTKIGSTLNAGLASVDVSGSVENITTPLDRLSESISNFNNAIAELATNTLNNLRLIGPEIKSIFERGIGKVSAETISKVQMTTESEGTIDKPKQEAFTLKNVIEKLDDIKTQNLTIGTRMLNVMDEQLAEMRNRQNFSTSYNAWVS